MQRNACKVLAVAMLLAGITGFASPGFMGFTLTPTHNLIHLLTGAGAAVCGWIGSDRSTRRLWSAVAILYATLTVLGFVLPGVLALLLGEPGLSARELMPDNLLNLALTAIALGVLRYATPDAGLEKA